MRSATDCSLAAMIPASFGPTLASTDAGAKDHADLNGSNCAACECIEADRLACLEGQPAGQARDKKENSGYRTAPQLLGQLERPEAQNQPYQHRRRSDASAAADQRKRVRALLLPAAERCRAGLVDSAA